jgi:hypothetical protein
MVAEEGLTVPLKRERKRAISSGIEVPPARLGNRSAQARANSATNQPLLHDNY